MSVLTGRNLFALWLHALSYCHQMAWIQVNGRHSSKIRFCWQCDRADIERVLGHSLEKPE